MEIKEDINPVMTQVKSIGDFSDVELTGEINRSIGDGAKFALLLAMLDHNYVKRPHLEKAGSDFEVVEDAISSLSQYRNSPLHTSVQDIQNLVTTNQLFKSQPLDAQLWQTMHPEPLSLFNDAKRLADDVVYNCPYHCQLSLKSQSDPVIEEDPTALYDILENLPNH